MPAGRRNVPGALLLLLSALGILFGALLAGGLTIWLLDDSQADIRLTEQGAAAAFAFLAALVALLNIPALLLSIRRLAGKPIAPAQKLPPRLSAWLLIPWLAVILAGGAASRSDHAAWVLVPLTVPAVLLPIGWLVAIARWGLPRPSPLREWGTLTVSLTAMPFLILALEIILLVAAVLAMVVLLGFNPALLERLNSLPALISHIRGGMEGVDTALDALFHDPIVLGAEFLIIGLAVPVIEELVKPLAVWLQARRALTPTEGYSLGLVSGGAFALLESAALVSQLAFNMWVSAVVLRGITSILHIGLTGWVGYGIARSMEQRQPRPALVSLLGASVLHGLWNAMALVSGFSTNPFATETMPPTANAVVGLTLGVMLLVLLTIMLVNRRIRRALGQQRAHQAEGLPKSP